MRCSRVRGICGEPSMHHPSRVSVRGHRPSTRTFCLHRRDSRGTMVIMGRAGVLRRSLRPASLLALLVALAITGGITWAVHSAVRSQEHRLLKERTAELALVFNSAVNAISP